MKNVYKDFKEFVKEQCRMNGLNPEWNNWPTLYLCYLIDKKKK